MQLRERLTARRKGAALPAAASGPAGILELKRTRKPTDCNFASGATLSGTHPACEGHDERFPS
jgi:hypothetical protein